MTFCLIADYICSYISQLDIPCSDLAAVILASSPEKGVTDRVCNLLAAVIFLQLASFTLQYIVILHICVI